MPEPINYFDDESMRRIARSVRSEHNTPHNKGDTSDPRWRRDSKSKQVFTGITTTHPDNPSLSTYPTSGCQFVVKLEWWNFPKEVGTCSTLERVGRSFYVVARTIDGSYLAEGTDVLLFKIPGKDGFRWWIIPAGDLEHAKVKLTECWKPLQSAAGTLMQFTGQGWVDTGQQITVYDADEVKGTVMGLPGETIPIFKYGDSRWENLGEYGLERRVKPKQDIPCGTMGTCIIWEAGEPEDPSNCGTADWYYDGEWSVLVNNCGTCTPVQPEIVPAVIPHTAYNVPCRPSGNPTACDASETQCEIECCNSWNSNHCAQQDREMWAKYMGKGVWDLRPLYKNQLYIANIAESCLSPEVNGPHPITNVRPLTYCMTDAELAAITEASNTFRRAAPKDYACLIVEDLTDCGEPTRHIFAVEAQCTSFAVDHQCEGQYFLQHDGECGLEGYLLQKSAVESCNTTTDTYPQVQFETQNVIIGFTHTNDVEESGGECKVEATYINACILRPEQPVTGTVTVLAPEAVAMVDDVYLDTDGCPVVVYTTIYAVCVDDDSTELTLDCTPCPSGSGQ